MTDSYRYGAGYKMNEDIQSKSEMKRQKALRESKSVDIKALREKAVARDADGYVNMIVGTEVILAMIERIKKAEDVLWLALKIEETCNAELGAWVSSKLALPVRKAAHQYFAQFAKEASDV